MPNVFAWNEHISSVHEDHYGLSSCALVATEGQVLTGNVDILRGKRPESISNCELLIKSLSNTYLRSGTQNLLRNNRERRESFFAKNITGVNDREQQRNPDWSSL